MKLERLIIYCIAAWSGYFVMGVELLSGRILAPFFGNSIFVWGGILAVFMTSLSIGYLLGGHLSRKNPSLHVLALLLAAEAIMTAPVVIFSDVILESISAVVADPRYGSLISSLALFFVPAVMTGTIAPYSIRLLVESVDSSGHSAGTLYFMSTLGSAAGTLVTSFYMVLWFDIYVIVGGMITISLVLSGLAAYVATKKEKKNLVSTSTDSFEVNPS